MGVARRLRAKLKTLAPGGRDVILVASAALLSIGRADLIRWAHGLGDQARWDLDDRGHDGLAVALSAGRGAGRDGRAAGDALLLARRRRDPRPRVLWPVGVQRMVGRRAVVVRGLAGRGHPWV